jgi:hypothetical protein
MPVMAASPQSEISRLMTSGMKPILPLEAQAQVEDVAPQRKRGLFGRKRP